MVILGGGLGGFTLAFALLRRGLGARVLEDEFGAIGYGIPFGLNAFHVFDRVGLTEAVLAGADSPAAVLMKDALDRKERAWLRLRLKSRAECQYIADGLDSLIDALFSTVKSQLALPNPFHTPWGGGSLLKAPTVSISCRQKANPKPEAFGALLPPRERRVCEEHNLF